MTGLFTGFITSLSIFQPPTPAQLFDDKAHWYNCEFEHEELDKLSQDVRDMQGNSKEDEHNLLDGAAAQ